MYWKVILDYGTFRNVFPVHSSEWAANLIANNWRSIAAFRGDKVKIKVEVVK